MLRVLAARLDGAHGKAGTAHDIFENVLRASYRLPHPSDAYVLLFAPATTLNAYRTTPKIL